MNIMCCTNADSRERPGRRERRNATASFPGCEGPVHSSAACAGTCGTPPSFPGSSPATHGKSATTPRARKCFRALGVCLSVIVRSTEGSPTGIRIPVAALKGLCPRPLDDGAANSNEFTMPQGAGQIARRARSTHRRSASPIARTRAEGPLWRPRAICDAP
jgi:hypothetical protein